MACMAQAQTVSVSVPSKVMVGETFRLQYTVNTKDVDGERTVSLSPRSIAVFAGTKDK